MDGAYYQKLEALVGCDQLNDWERTTFGDIFSRNPDILSKKQEACINKSAEKYLGLKAPSEEEALPDRYDNCEINMVQNEGWYITDNTGTRWGKPMTRTEARLVLSWFTVYMSQLTQMQTQQPAPAPTTQPDCPF